VLGHTDAIILSSIKIMRHTSPTSTEASGQEPNSIGRKIRAHRKTRSGCGNCKLRRVKVRQRRPNRTGCSIRSSYETHHRKTNSWMYLQCDETRPECRRCTDFGVICNYDGGQPDNLQPRYLMSGKFANGQEGVFSSSLVLHSSRPVPPFQILFQNLAPPPAAECRQLVFSKAVTLQRIKKTEMGKVSSMIRPQLQQLYWDHIYQLSVEVCALSFDVTS
jgi:hypothetical protein